VYPDSDEPDPDLEPTLIQGIPVAGPTPALHEARELFERHDYIGCVQRLRRVPGEQRTPDERELKARATDAVEEIGALKDALRRGVRERRYDGLLPKARRYLELKPDDEKYRRLSEKLEQRERRARDEPPAETEPAATTVPELGDDRERVQRFLLRYVQVGAFAGAVCGALIGGFWKPEGYFLGGLIGGIVAAANEWVGERR